jgi:hypothetical protein
MFKLLITSVLLTFFASANDCISIKDSLDREYCFKKQLQTEQKKYDNILANNKAGISKKEKDESILRLEREIKISSEEANYLMEKEKMLTSYKLKITALKLKVTTKQKSKKTNKLKDSLRKFGIKL